MDAILQQTNRRYPSLDGLRAISISLVILDHWLIRIPFHQTVVNFGNLGVRVFFVISGFIITTLLMTERREFGQISLRNFYIRRCSRILPLWSIFVLFILGADWILHRTPPARDVWSVLLFNVDYMKPVTGDFKHLWSLSVEEKFYLLWPLLFRSMDTTKKAAIMAGGTMLVVPLLRFVSSLNGASDEELLWPFHHSVDAIATGCLLALAQFRLHRTPAWRSFIDSHWWIAAPVCVLGIAALHDLGPIFWLVGVSLMNIAIAVTIDAMIRKPASITGRLLNARPAVLVGLWSYGIYVWQQPFMTHTNTALGKFPVNVGLILTISGLGYFLIEEPMRELGRRFSDHRAGPLPKSSTSL